MLGEDDEEYLWNKIKHQWTLQMNLQMKGSEGPVYLPSKSMCISPFSIRYTVEYIFHIAKQKQKIQKIIPKLMLHHQ